MARIITCETLKTSLNLTIPTISSNMIKEVILSIDKKPLWWFNASKLHHYHRMDKQKAFRLVLMCDLLDVKLRIWQILEDLWVYTKE